MEFTDYSPMGLNTTSKRYHTSKRYFEQTATSLSALGRDELKRRIKNFQGRFKLDFTEDYLNALSANRLRHILLAALINAKPRGQRSKTNALDSSL